MGRVIAHAIFSLDQDRYARRRPDGSAKAKRFGPFCQQLRQVGQLFRSQFRGSTRRRTMTQGFWSQAFAFGDPLAHGPFGHPQSGGNIFLFPSLLVEFPGAQASSFAPIFWKRCAFSHTSFHRVFSFKL